MGTTGEVCILVKFSPKREKMLGKITDNIEGTFDEETINEQASKLDKLCITRWTIRAICFRKIIDSYKALLVLWNKSLEQKLDFETQSRIIGCKKQMESFSFYFGLNFGQRLFAHTDNLSKTLQKEKMLAIQGKELADLTVKTLQSIRSDPDYKLFYKSVEKSAGKISEISPPTVPRKRKKPRYDILQFFDGNPNSSGETYHPETPYDHFKPIYMECINTIISAIKNRFEQPGFQLFGQVEQLFLKAI